jgi:hypothetical protein
MGRTTQRPRQRRTIRRALIAAAIAIPVGALGAAAPALAKVEPNQEFLPFVNCPVKVKGVRNCLVARTESGEFKVGSKTVPITKLITLEGGLKEGSTQLVPPTTGSALSKVPLPLPGGLIGLPGLEGLGGGATEVTATTELAGEVQVDESVLVTGSAPAVILPIKVKLDNTVLGKECYIGSDSAPIVLHLTTGTTSPPAPNKPITGNPGHLTVNAGATIFTISGNSLVDNSFAAPGVAGCGESLSALINPIVDVDSGLPAAAGQNTAILNGTILEASAREVKRSHVIKKPKKEKAPKA